MKNCFGYVRVSSHKQGEGVSLEAQKDAIRHFAEKNGIAIIRWFEEQQTAAKSGRPVFNTMLKALKSGEAGGLVMHKIDRSARNFFDWARIGELADSGIDVHFATESLDFRSRGGRLTANIQMAVAEDYVRNLRAEIHKGQRGQLERGFYPFNAPIGYVNNGKCQLKTIDPVKGPLVKTAFELYASGQYSLRSLRHEIARRGLCKPSGEPLSKGCLEKFLTNPFYAGIIRIRRTGEVYQGAHEALITPQLFEQVTQIRTGKGAKKVTRHNHQFRGLFRCGNCGRSMIPERQKGHVYYRCQFPDCPRNCVREESLAAAIAKVLDGAWLTETVIAEIDRRVITWTQKRAKPDHARVLTMQLAKLDERMDQIEDAAIAGIIDADNFNRRKERLLSERLALVKEAEKADRFQHNPGVIRKFLERVKNLPQHYEFADPAEKREIVEIAVSNRTVKDKNVFVEPSDWLAKTRDAVGFFSCADARTASRTSPDVPDEKAGAGSLENTAGNGGSLDSANRYIDTLIESAASLEAQRIIDLFMHRYRNAAAGEVDYRASGTTL